MAAFVYWAAVGPQRWVPTFVYWAAVRPQRWVPTADAEVISITKGLVSQAHVAGSPSQCPHCARCPPTIPCRRPYLRAFWSRCRQSMASGQCLRDCRKRCTWGRRMLLGGKSPVHNQSSSQPRSSLYLREEAWCPAGLLTRAAHACPHPHPSLRPTWTHPPVSQIQIVLLKVWSTNLPQATHLLVTRR